MNTSKPAACIVCNSHCKNHTSRLEYSATRGQKATHDANLNSTTVTSTFEVEEQVQDASLKRTSEPVLAGKIPLLIHNPESNILIRWSSLQAHANTMIYSLAMIISLALPII